MTELTTPYDTQPVFPQRCARCFVDGNLRLIQLSARRASWTDSTVLEFVGRIWVTVLRCFVPRIRIGIPHCSACYGVVVKMMLVRRLVLIGIIGINVVVFYMIKSVVGDIRSDVAAAIQLGVIIVSLFSYTVWESKMALPVALTAEKRGFSWEFQNDSYAKEFAAVNCLASDSAG